MKSEKSCGAIVFNGDEVLLIKQKPGFYGFPKGHVENMETEVETAIREVKEETNVDIKINENLRFTLNYLKDDKINKEVVYFVATPINNISLKAQESEVENVFWVKKEEVQEILTFDNAKELFKNVLSIILK